MIWHSLIILLILVILSIGVWGISIVKNNVAIVDPCWGSGFVLVALIAMYLRDMWSTYEVILVSLVAVWGSRLSVYLLIRNWGHAEDHRYAAMRAKRPKTFWIFSLFSVFLLQAFLLWIVSWPLQAFIHGKKDSISIFVLGVGIGLWAFGFIFETIADIQLSWFKSNPDNKGRVMDHGLWALSRHPNYFGEFCIWWGYYLIASSTGQFWTIFSSLLMSFLLLRVSGVALLEKDIGERRPEYREYQRRVNAFFPGLPKMPSKA
ncbi:MAG: DUF1295 domain-containing protein [Pirellulaceae bacterium]